jgi:hypothetical protein
MGAIKMLDAEVSRYMQSFAPIERFILFQATKDAEVQIMFFDDRSVLFSFMEDDEDVHSRAVKLLKSLNARFIEGYELLLQLKDEAGLNR